MVSTLSPDQNPGGGGHMPMGNAIPGHKVLTKAALKPPSPWPWRLGDAGRGMETALLT